MAFGVVHNLTGLYLQSQSGTQPDLSHLSHCLQKQKHGEAFLGT